MIHLYLRDILTVHLLWVEWYFSIIEITIISEVPDIPEGEVGVWESWLLRYRQGAWGNTSECKEDKVKTNLRRLCRKSLPPYVLIIIIAGPHGEWQLMLFPMDSRSTSKFLTTRDACSVSIDFNDPTIFLWQKIILQCYIYMSIKECNPFPSIWEKEVLQKTRIWSV